MAQGSLPKTGKSLSIISAGADCYWYRHSPRPLSVTTLTSPTAIGYRHGYLPPTAKYEHFTARSRPRRLRLFPYRERLISTEEHDGPMFTRIPITFSCSPSNNHRHLHRSTVGDHHGLQTPVGAGRSLISRG